MAAGNKPDASEHRSPFSVLRQDSTRRETLIFMSVRVIFGVSTEHGRRCPPDKLVGVG